jgi:hypothetical protein
MGGKAYYLTTLGDWQRHASRFANSHFIVLGSRDVPGGAEVLRSTHVSPTVAPNADAKILALIEADEGVHLWLEDEPAFEPLPHPLAQKPISAAAQAMLAPYGVAPGATTFEAAEAVARVHPLLRHRVF